ncbi:MAG: hypothetical protein CO149_06025 [Nitrospirae bacterium CG_4_9_14_3_um_filter_51_5]|nr:MAG: hypothetical protein CO149_06025 [Nitrospirae bacterium CG_4_9_14_3_um_filter_51_5]
MLPSDSIYKLRQEFRGHLEEFYAELNLAPPYHSIEKAVQHFSNALRTKPEEFRQGLLQDASKKWAVFQEIFLASGLQKKHRGIIEQLALTSSFSVSAGAPESRRFLKNFSAISQEPPSDGTSLTTHPSHSPLTNH